MWVGVKFFVFLLVYQVIFSEVLFHTRNAFPDLFGQTAGFLVLLQILGLLLPLGIWLGLRKEQLFDHMPNFKLGRRNTFMVLGISFFLLPFMAVIASITTLFTPNVASNLFEETQQISFWVMILAVAVTPAIIEEVVFRGYIQHQCKGMSDRFIWVAMLNGLLFGLIHFSWSQFFYAFAMGIIFAYMVHITRSVRSAMLSHFFMNGFNIAMFRFVSWAAAWMERYLYEAGDMEALYAFRYGAEVDPVRGVMMVGIVALVFSPFLFILWRAFVRYNERRFMEYEVRLAVEAEAVQRDENSDN